MILIDILESLRPKHWTKNFFIFAGLLFSQNIFNLPLLFKVTAAFFIFCLLAGSIYILNDLTDLEEDRHHPLKRHRPIASGRLKPIQAVGALIIFLIFSLTMSYRLGYHFFLVAVGYLLFQVAYSFWLKHAVILDVLVVASGFLLRVVGGAVVVKVEMSSWLLICTIFLSLFLALSKRRYDLVAIGEVGQHQKKVLGEYSPRLLDQMISMITASTLVSYVLYTMSEETVNKFGTKNLIFTVPFVLYGIFRYLYLIYKKEEGGNPENILIRDIPLIVDIVLWVGAVGIILYAG